MRPILSNQKKASACPIFSDSISDKVTMA